MRYRRAFYVMLGLRLRYQLFYSLYSNAHLARVGFGNKKIFFYIIVTLMKDRCYIKNILVPYPELFLVVLTK